jgi:hypothetical protein
MRMRAGRPRLGSAPCAVQLSSPHHCSRPLVVLSAQAGAPKALTHDWREIGKNHWQIVSPPGEASDVIDTAQMQEHVRRLRHDRQRGRMDDVRRRLVASPLGPRGWLLGTRAHTLSSNDARARRGPRVLSAGISLLRQPLSRRTRQVLVPITPRMARTAFRTRTSGHRGRSSIRVWRSRPR